MNMFIIRIRRRNTKLIWFCVVWKKIYKTMHRLPVVARAINA